MSVSAADPLNVYLCQFCPVGGSVPATLARVRSTTCTTKHTHTDYY